MIFCIGSVAGVIWKSRRDRSTSLPPPPQRVEETQWALTREIVSRSLQTHSFRTEKLRRNSNDEVVWRWLMDSIAKYPQNWVKLNISDKESYGIVLYPMKALESTELIHYNKELSEKGMPPLRAGKQYLPIEVYEGNIICPNWSGLVDVEEPRLVYFLGMSG